VGRRAREGYLVARAREVDDDELVVVVLSEGRPDGGLERWLVVEDHPDIYNPLATS
jgi:hypothetical protein